MRTVHTKSLPALLLLTGTLLASSACVYKMPIQQGNFLDKKQVDQLEPGMTRSQVAFLLGTPMVPNGFDKDRWDYYYYAKFSRKYAADSYRVTVYFKDEKVDHVDKPPEPQQPPVKTPPAETALAKDPPVQLGPTAPPVLPNTLSPQTPGNPELPAKPPQ
jgi:outer membrane protein assembly factor BamE